MEVLDKMIPKLKLTKDAKKTVRGKFQPPQSAEARLARQLKKVAHASSQIIESHIEGLKIRDPIRLQALLKEYSESLGPWAARQSANMLKSVSNSNKRAYQNKSKAIGAALNLGAGNDASIIIAQALMREQVELIKSIPLEAGIRAQDIALKAATEGLRAQPDQSIIEDLQKQMGMTAEVATNRAKLIARTETARATASINEARATAIGSNQYRWHNSGDGAVRHSHKIYQGRALQGRIFDWNNPPTLDDGMRGHPGTFPNCRCFAEPVFDDE